MKLWYPNLYLLFGVCFLLTTMIVMGYSGNLKEDKNTNNHAQMLILQNNSFRFIGGFRFPAKTLGDSRIAYSPGIFGIDELNNTMFVTGNGNTKGIAEFTIPPLSTNSDLTQWNFAKPIQEFVNILDKKVYNPQKIDRISGLEIIDGQLIINAVEYYDAPNDNDDTTLIIHKPKDLSSSDIEGFFKLDYTVHAAGWMSIIPEKYISKLNGNYIFGNASNFPISSRQSIGPSAFTLFSQNLLTRNKNSPAIKLNRFLDYSLKKPLHEDRYNKTKLNKIWTISSRAVYGFIVPNSDQYLIIGTSSGHESGLGYKIKQNSGYKCGGPCAYDSEDHYNHFWSYNLSDLITAKEKRFSPSEIKPLISGKFKTAIEDQYGFAQIIGADYDFSRNILYLMMRDVDKAQSEYESIHVMIAYQLGNKGVN